MMEVKQTQRGFDIIDFNDDYGKECSIQKSSSAEEDAIWLGANKIGLKEFVAFRKPDAWVDVPEVDDFSMEHHFVANNRMHLTREQVSYLLPHLERFVRTGELT